MNELQLCRFLDATFLKKPADFPSNDTYQAAIIDFFKDVRLAKAKAIVVYPEELLAAASFFSHEPLKPILATVIDFPFGTATTSEKITACFEAISLGAEELDVVCHYQAFLENDTVLFYNDIFALIDSVVSAGKTIKIILETAAFNNEQLIRIASKIKQYCVDHFHENDLNRIFLKSSTGFFPTANGNPAGATKESIAILLENGFPLPVKASGGIRTFEQAQQFIKMGVKRIGTSAPLLLVNQEKITSDY
jgi:deoxyribose-phosphate aldolase